MHVNTRFRCVGYRYINGIEPRDIRLYPRSPTSVTFPYCERDYYLTMRLENIAKSLDSSLGPKGKMLKEEFLVMVYLAYFHLI